MTTKAFRFPLKRSALLAKGIPARRTKPMSLAVLRVYNRLVNASTATCTRSQLSGHRKPTSPALVRIKSQKMKAEMKEAFRLIDEMSKVKDRKDKEGKKVSN